MGSTGGFGELLSMAEQLTTDIDSIEGEGGGSDLPRVERNLKQILQAGQQLWSRNQQAATTDVNASILLGSKGYDLPRASAKLSSLSSAHVFSPCRPARDLDITGFLRSERENAILGIIEETKRDTFAYTQKMFWESMQNDWEQEKQKIMNNLLGSNNDLLDITLQSEVVNVSGMAPSLGVSSLSNIECAYVAAVQRYQTTAARPLLHYLTDASTKINNKDVSSMWRMVEYMSGEAPLITHSNALLTRTNPQSQATFIAKARKYLEDSFAGHMQSRVMASLHLAGSAGEPGMLQLVKSYLTIQTAGGTVPATQLEDGTVLGQSAWAMLYTALRAGCIDAAIQIVDRAGGSLGELRAVLSEIQQSSENRLSPGNETSLQLTYRQHVRTSVDPYKRVVYCVLGACDMSDDHGEVCTTIEEYLWVKLCQLKPEPTYTRQTSAMSERLTLNKFQSLMLHEYGESHFKAYENPWTYFTILFLTAQFEAAVEFLSRIEPLRPHAVHAALALHENKLLILPQDTRAPMICKEDESGGAVSKLNLARLVISYTKRFAATNPKDAIQYFHFLSDMESGSGDNMFSVCVSDLVMESREYDMLLGCIDPCTGDKQPGYLDQLKSKVNTAAITEKVASLLEEQGLFEDAIRLYDLARDHEKMLSLLNTLLSQTCSLPPVDNSDHSRYMNTALSVADRMKRVHGHTATQDTLHTFYKLVDISTFFELYHNNEYTEAIQQLTALKLVPMRLSDKERHIQTFSQLGDVVKRVIPDLLLITINIYSHQHKQAKGNVGSLVTRKPYDQSKTTELKTIEERADCIIAFAGTVPYRMPGDTNARLVNARALMS